MGYVKDYDVDNTREVLAMARDLIDVAKNMSASETHNIQIFYKFTFRLIIAFVICVMIMGFCIVYALHQAYNYDSYPTIPNINNTNNNNVNEKGGNS